VRIAIAILACGILETLAVAGPPAREHAPVNGVVSVIRKTKGAADNGDVAVWLTRAAAPGRRTGDAAVPRARLKITQQEKHFEPRVLIVPAGSIVDFPNLDPFFHNVFSMFDGTRLDLGLYEAGSSRSVAFTTPGICYIFCNIHPEMSAVVVVVDTPYYGITNRAGEFTLRNVPPGQYELSVWHDRYKPEHPTDLPRAVVVPEGGVSLGVIRLVESDDVIAPHKNKYGRDYPTPPSLVPGYKGR